MGFLKCMGAFNKCWPLMFCLQGLLWSIYLALEHSYVRLSSNILRFHTNVFVSSFSVEEMHRLEALWALHAVCFGLSSLGAADLFRRHEPDGWVQSPPSPALSCRETVLVCWWPILGPSQNGPHCAIQRALWRAANICPLYARFPQQKENTA